MASRTMARDSRARAAHLSQRCQCLLGGRRLPSLRDGGCRRGDARAHRRHTSVVPLSLRSADPSVLVPTATCYGRQGGGRGRRRIQPIHAQRF